MVYETLQWQSMIISIKNSQKKITVSECDSHLAGVSWQLNSVGYARRTIRERGTGKYKTILMHRHILQAKDGEVVEHINGDKLDNRRSNIRVCTQSENLSRRVKTNKPYSSGFYGVSKRIDYRTKNKRIRWQAQLVVNGKHFCKVFDKEEDAARYRDLLVTKYGYKHTPLNFPKHS